MTAASKSRPWIHGDDLDPSDAAGWDDGKAERGIGQCLPDVASWTRKHTPPVRTDMDKLTVISGCLFLAADIFAIASIANPDWISTGDSAGTFSFVFENGIGVNYSDL